MRATWSLRAKGDIAAGGSCFHLVTIFPVFIYDTPITFWPKDHVRAAFTNGAANSTGRDGCWMCLSDPEVDSPRGDSLVCPLPATSSFLPPAQTPVKEPQGHCRPCRDLAETADYRWDKSVSILSKVEVNLRFSFICIKLNLKSCQAGAAQRVKSGPWPTRGGKQPALPSQVALTGQLAGLPCAPYSSVSGLRHCRTLNRQD